MSEEPSHQTKTLEHAKWELTPPSLGPQQADTGFQVAQVEAFMLPAARPTIVMAEVRTNPRVHHFGATGVARLAEAIESGKEQSEESTMKQVYGDNDDQYWNRRLPFRLSLDISGRPAIQHVHKFGIDVDAARALCVDARVCVCVFVCVCEGLRHLKRTKIMCFNNSYTEL